MSDRETNTRLQIRYGRVWDCVAMGGEVDAIARFASHFPGRQWRVTDKAGVVLKSGRTAPRKEAAR